MKIPIKYDQFPYLQAKLTMAKQIRARLPKPLPWLEGSINTIFQEIAECLIFGLNHSAISLCGGFLEQVLRLALYERVTNTKALVIEKDLTKDPIWRWLEEQFSLGALIREAQREGIILGKNRKWWNDFPGIYRNLYAHCKFFSIVRNETELKTFDDELDQPVDVEIPVQKDRANWAIYKSDKDRRDALELFREVTERILEIISDMKWFPREPENLGEEHLARQYNKFFSEVWGSYESKFLDLPPDFYADY